MTLQEKLDLIDEEIRKLHLFCTKSGYSSRQIERFAHPFFARDVHDMAPSIWPSGKAWKRRIVSLSTVVIAAALLFRFDPAYQLVCAVSKKGAIEVLPVWDWTQIYDSRCWV
ncbi:uncharacterized protein LOC106013950, partial [Aplysia californica]|uniref:Uncharacterized protein LOC106013950 n=1 Tax=Aplysia californica TaxID=6500 RepID=A0ABM1AEU7_APLCA